MISSISWKNVWRNRQRSMIVIASVTLGTVAGIFVAGLMKGWVDQRIKSAVYTEVSHLKIQNPNYLINEEISLTIPNYEEITNNLNSNNNIKAWTPRVKVMAMANTANGNSGVILKGIDLEREKQVSDVGSYILPDGGTFFETDLRLPPIVISDKTAEQLKLKNYILTDAVIDSLRKLEIPDEIITKLEPLKGKRYNNKKQFVSELKTLLPEKAITNYGTTLYNTSSYYKLKSKIAFTFTGKNGELSYQTYQLCGVYKTSNTMFDALNAYVLYSDLAGVTSLEPNEYHEIAMILNNPQEKLNSTVEKLSQDYPNVSVMSWKSLAPDAGMMADYMDFYYYMIMGIIFFALAFGIINTMLMAIMERTREIGMLMAIGMNKKRVFGMIMLETVYLTLTGSVVGMALGWGIILLTGHTGLNFSSVAEGFEAVGYAALVYPDIDAVFFFGLTLMVIVIGILASIIPARKALSLNPVEAIRME